MEISAGLVKELRERTGVGMMECKKALVAANGNIEKAIEDLRKAGQAKAVKKGDRIAAEGLIVINVAKDAKSAAMVEINCETDFVAREEQFRKFTNVVSGVVLAAQIDDVAALITKTIAATNKTVEETRLALIATLGENIAIRRACYLQVKDGVIGAYLHGGNDGARIASMVAVDRDDISLAKDLAMQVAAMKPEYIAEQDIPAERIGKEKEIFMVEVIRTNAGKPADILEKIVAGKLKKLAKEITLLGQEFVKDSDLTIEQLLNNSKAKVTHMLRYEVGEGIEKKASNFMEEVMSQVRG